MHRRQVEPLAVGLGQRHADVARRVAHHERHQLRRRLLGREDQVALVLAVRVVDHHHGPARGQIRERPLDRGEARRPRRRPAEPPSAPAPAAAAASGGPATVSPPACWTPPPRCSPPPPAALCRPVAAAPSPPGAYPAMSRSTYFATTSTSRLTVSPTARDPSVVCASVVGISATENVAPSVPATVSDTPSTVIDPFSTTYRARWPGRLKRQLVAARAGVAAAAGCRRRRRGPARCGRRGGRRRPRHAPG